MDSGNSGRPAHLGQRMFPGYTLAELEASYADRLFMTNADPVQTAKIKAEIDARKSGKSKVFVVPQVRW